MDPIGKQKKIASNEYHPRFQKIIDGGGAQEKYQGQRNMSSGTREAVKGKVESEWQGKKKANVVYKHGEYR
jgi:hypothetical protein